MLSNAVLVLIYLANYVAWKLFRQPESTQSGPEESQGRESRSTASDTCFTSSLFLIFAHKHGLSQFWMVIKIVKQEPLPLSLLDDWEL